MRRKKPCSSRDCWKSQLQSLAQRLLPGWLLPRVLGVLRWAAWLPFRPVVALLRGVGLVRAPRTSRVWAACARPLCALDVRDEGTIEDDGEGCRRFVAFAEAGDRVAQPVQILPSYFPPHLLYSYEVVRRSCLRCSTML